MLEKIKHNKIKNTGLIYQFLIKKIIEQKIDGKKPVAYSIFKNYFNNNKVLGEQLAIYNALIKSSFDNTSKAAVLLQQIMNIRMKLDDVKLDKEKYFCIKEIKQNYDLKSFFSADVPNYKVHASIYKIFESLKRVKYDPVQIAKSKNELLEYISKPKQEIELDQDMEYFKKQSSQFKEQALVIMVENYNKKYDSLNQKQKKVLQKYTYTMSNQKPLVEHIEKQILLTYHKLFNKDETLVQSLKENVTKIQEINDVQDKLQILLNLYQIEQSLNKEDEQFNS